MEKHPRIMIRVSPELREAFDKTETDEVREILSQGLLGKPYKKPPRKNGRKELKAPDAFFGLIDAMKKVGSLAQELEKQARR